MNEQQYDRMLKHIEKTKLNKLPPPQVQSYPKRFKCFNRVFVKANIDHGYKVKIGTGYSRFYVPFKVVSDIIRYFKIEMV